ncbi:MAG: chromosomal replication initiator protein DnaA [Olegusella sp.]|jgi:chromosomal replication initiator protein|nr:chromosomal replication initiator protein DnaA [Olegusella sp.]MCI1933643.1 DnaA/Hda family protein [Atopobiaceae bacterium]
MEQERQTDADVLWSDVLLLLEKKKMAPSTLAMLSDCTPIVLLNGKLTISTSLGFARRKIEQEQKTIEECLSEAAFQPIKLEILLSRNESPNIPTQTTVASDEEIEQLSHRDSQDPQQITKEETHRNNILAEDIPEVDSKLTFDRFVAGEENILALEAAKQVANGENKSYNPLFIYGKSGLGKTHLLRAIQNYISANDPSRLCIYRSATQFVEDYRMSMNDPSAPPRNVLAKSYQDVDVLIIDDIQNMCTAAGTIRFFFETFNALTSHGKQIVLAADRSPSQLGMGESKFDERDTSRMDSGVTVSIQVPDYELKLNLVNAFYERMKADAKTEHIQGLDGTINEDLRRLMAERAGTSIRLIKGYVQSCLMLAHQKQQKNDEMTREDVIRLAQQKWPTGQHIVTIEQIQKAVEGYYDISHDDLVGSKRNKELMEPRHVAIWLTREMTDNTLADIGKKFGNRTHATVKHSIAWVDNLKSHDRLFHDRVEAIHDSITDIT